MSSNRLMYDTCEYKNKLDESSSTLGYLLDNMKYENCNKCRMELGVLGGSGVSHIKGNLVDLEADLFGITRKASLCPSKKYNSSCATQNITEYVLSLTLLFLGFAGIAFWLDKKRS